MRYTFLLTCLLVTLGLSAQTFQWDKPASTKKTVKTPMTATVKPSVPTTQPQEYGTTLTARSPLAAKEMETGYATFYADYLHNQPTAYGEIYRHDQLTASHNTYPLGTLVQVTRSDNGQSVTVRVNDRGTTCEGCVITLSKSAAEQIDLVRSGKARVVLQSVGYSNSNPASTNPTATPVAYSAPTPSTTLASRGYSPVTPPPTASADAASRIPTGAVIPTNSTVTRREVMSDPSRPVAYSQPESRMAPRPMVTEHARDEVLIVANNTSGYGVQLGAFRNYANAERQVVSLQQRGLNSLFIKQDRSADGSELSRIVSGPFASVSEAQVHLRDLKGNYGLDGLVLKMN